MRDLEIRGAGDLLGPEQSGHVAALGFELYVEMLDEAVAELIGAKARRSSPGARRRARRRVRPGCRTSRPRRSRSTSTAASRSSEDEDELRELVSATEDRYGPLPEPVENLFAIQEAKLKLARLGADYLVFRGGRVTVGPLALGSAEVRALVGVAPTLIYSTQKREVSLRVEIAQGCARAARCYCPGPFGRIAAAFLVVRTLPQLLNSPQPLPNTPSAIRNEL